jgi:hypothetical protein
MLMSEAKESAQTQSQVQSPINEAWEAIRKVYPWLPASSEGWHQHVNGGGWVQNTTNVSDKAQVCGEALVYDKAQVCGEALVYDKARVCGEALVCGEAQVCGEALVCGEAQVCEGEHTRSPIYIQGTRYFIACVGPGLIQSGCITKPLAWWLEYVERCAEEHDYTQDQQKEYRLHVEHIAAWMQLYGMEAEAKSGA